MPARTTKRLTRAEKRAANRARLLEAAVRVFADSGYHGASVEDIAEQSGLSNGALYYNFTSKEKLFLALMDERMQARICQIEEGFADLEADPDATEAQVRRATARDPRSLRDRQEWTLLFEFLAHATREPRFGRDFRGRVRKMRKVLARVVDDRAAAEGAQMRIPAEHTAIAIQALGWGLAAQRLADPAGVPDDLLGTLLIALLRGLTQDAPSGH
jgi:AcrR family transcriptional regulator